MAKIEAAVFRFGWDCLDWIFPPECGGCGKNGYRWCKDCAEDVIQLKEPLCKYCGQSLPANNPTMTNTCQTCRKEKPHFTALRSYGIFGGALRKGLHSLKYRSNLGLGDRFSHMMLDVLHQTDWPIDMIVPVPLSEQRLNERGYNQAAYLARPLAWDAELVYCPPAVSRLRETATQVGLSLEERKRNMQDAFRAVPRYIKGKSILLIDDVATTGATLNACSRALLDAGAQAVYGLTLARAQYIT